MSDNGRRAKLTIKELFSIKKEIPMAWLVTILISGFSGYGWLMWDLSAFYKEIRQTMDDAKKDRLITQDLVTRMGSVELQSRYHDIMIKDIYGQVSVQTKRIDVHDREFENIRGRINAAERKK